MSPKILSGKIYNWIDQNWYNSRIFFYGEGKSTFFSIIFLFIYFIIQMLNLGTLTLMSMVGLERIFMPSRYRKQYNDTKEVKNAYIDLKKENEKLRQIIENILKVLSDKKYKNVYIPEIQKIVSGKNKKREV